MKRVVEDAIVVVVLVMRGARWLWRLGGYSVVGPDGGEGRREDLEGLLEPGGWEDWNWAAVEGGRLDMDMDMERGGGVVTMWRGRRTRREVGAGAGAVVSCGFSFDGFRLFGCLEVAETGLNGDVGRERNCVIGYWWCHRRNRADLRYSRARFLSPQLRVRACCFLGWDRVRAL